MVSALALALTAALHAPVPAYVLVLDAGSSGTRVHAYVHMHINGYIPVTWATLWYIDQVCYICTNLVRGM